MNQLELSMTPARSSWSAMLPPSSSRTMLTILSVVRGPGLRASTMSQATEATAITAPIRTKDRNALSDESSDRRGFFGFFCCGRSGATGAGPLARRNRLARGRGGSPPSVGGALMPTLS